MHESDGGLRPGQLVVLDPARDPYIVCARNAWVVLGPAPRSANGKPQVWIHSVNDGRVYNGRIQRTKPMMALESECTPIEAFGIRVKQVLIASRGHCGCDYLFLEKDESLPVTAGRRWGLPYDAYPSEKLKSSVQKEELALLIERRFLEQQREAA